MWTFAPPPWSPRALGWSRNIPASLPARTSDTSPPAHPPHSSCMFSVLLRHANPCTPSLKKADCLCVYRRLCFPVLLVAVYFPGAAAAQSPPAQRQLPPAPHPQALAQNPSNGCHFARRRHPDGAAAQPQPAGCAHHYPAEPGGRDHRQSASESGDFGRLRSFCRFSSRANSARITSTTSRSSTWASAICSSEARSGNTACKRPRT